MATDPVATDPVATHPVTTDPVAGREPPEAHPGHGLPLVVSMLRAGGASGGVAANVLLVAAAAAVAVSAAVHLHLWQDGYRHIPTIGPLFLLQVVAGFALAVCLAALRRVWIAVVTFGFVCSTVGGFLLSVTVGLFGFTDTWSAPFAGMAFAYEIAAVVLLAAGVALSARRALRKHAEQVPARSPVPIGP